MPWTISRRVVRGVLALAFLRFWARPENAGPVTSHRLVSGVGFSSAFWIIASVTPRPILLQPANKNADAATQAKMNGCVRKRRSR
jgi:hypothetical protein